MRSVFTCTIVIVVSSAFAQRPFAHHAENFRKAVPHHNHHDQENFDRRMDKIARWHKIEPHQPPLRPHQTVPWLRWVHEGRWAAQANKNTELHKVRARLLEEKLRPNHLAFKPRINPQLKPRLKKENARTKRETEKSENENVQKETEIEVNVRHKRDIRMAQQVPEIIMKSYPDAEMPQASDQFHGRVKELEKRGKRQVVYFINRPPQQLARSPRTTPNPFIRDTHIDDYDIIRPEVGEREGMIPTIESGSSDLGSYPLMSETSDLEYESDYTISMSDSEEWHNYPLTTPSGPNPGWQLSTLADIYQKQKRSKNQISTPEKTRHSIKTIHRVWQENGDQVLTRAKRSPKERKPKIGAYKEKLKQRRKLKDMKRKRRIIRNSKEDKAVKEDFQGEKASERLLVRPRIFPRQTAYQVEEASGEILWSNGTHNIVEDKTATVKWINETHYVIYKDKDNSTEEWYNQHHVLCYNEEWENKTSEEKRNATIGVDYEDEDQDSSPEEVVKKKSAGKTAVKKKKTGKKKSRKGDSNKKKPEKSKKKIPHVKNVDIEPKDPRNIKKSKVSEEEIEGKKKKEKKVKRDGEKDSSEIEKKKKKKSKIKDDKDEEDSHKKRKSRKSDTHELDEKERTADKKEKRKKDQTKKYSDKGEISDKKSKAGKEKKKDSEKRKKTEKSNKSREGDVNKNKKHKKHKTGAENNDKDEKRKKRSIYHSDESNRVNIRWEKVKKRDSNSWTSHSWTVFGGSSEDKSEVYDASYELIETRNITKKHH